MLNAVAFVCRIPDSVTIKPTGCRPKDDEILSCRNEKSKKEKYFAWKLLEYAFHQIYNSYPDNFGYSIDEYGRWSHKNYYFSVSHSHNYAACTVSDLRTGLDIEMQNSEIKEKRLLEIILSSNEKSLLSEDAMNKALFYKYWTLKEALFKAFGSEKFIPSKIDTLAYNDSVISREFYGVDEKYCLSMAGDHLFNPQIQFLDYSNGVFTNRNSYSLINYTNEIIDT